MRWMGFTAVALAWATLPAFAGVAGSAATQETKPGPAVVTDQAAARSIRVGQDTLYLGGLTVDAGTTRSGPIVVAGGDLVVRGTITGDAISILGDVIVSPDGQVTGNVRAVLGTVRDSGVIGGTANAFESISAGATIGKPGDAREAPMSTTDALRLSLGWVIVLLLIGLGVLVFAGSYLDGVVETLEQSFWRSLGIGVLGGLGLIPGLVLVLVALAISVLGILLIPFAAVAYLVIAAGLVTLGFLAVARVTGHSVGSGASRRLSARGDTLRALMIGIVLLMALWVVAASLSWASTVAAVLRAVAICITFVASTAGFGAAILSRAGTRRELEAPAPAAAPEAVGWQTPTPVTGVAAARRSAVAGNRGSEGHR